MANDESSIHAAIETDGARAESAARPPGRREAIRILGVLGAGALLACGSGSDASQGTDGSGAGAGGAGGGGGAPSGSGDASSAADAATAIDGGRANGDDAGAGNGGTSGGAGEAGTTPSCTLTTEQEEGPFYVALDMIRSDITDGKAGVPLQLSFTIVDTTTCKPLANAAVDIWHCDNGGLYSAEASQGTSGQSFHRGVQLTDASGTVRFTTVYPGWYPGRTVHVHIKVHVGGSASGSTYSGGHVSHTGNVFFPQTNDDQVAAVAPYTANSAARTMNANDNVWKSQGGSAYVLSVNGSVAAGFTAGITLGVDPSATPALVGIHS